MVISIHALREEGDARCSRSWPTGQKFLSTPSARRATAGIQYADQLAAISIHALREEGDDLQRGFDNQSVIFLSTPSARRATEHIAMWIEAKQFLSTPSARRATERTPHPVADYGISIHALREEGDACRTERPAGHGYFYPRPPRGGRPLNADFGVVGHDFYPRPPRGGRLPGELSGHADAEFLSTPSARRATKKLVKAIAAIQFLSTPSARRATAAARTAAGTASHNFYPRPPRGGRP